MEASRLERLLTLLETGTNDSTRLAAAQQIASIAAAHPRDLLPILNKIMPRLVNKKWETRKAAAQAIEAISKNVGDWIGEETLDDDNNNENNNNTMSDVSKPSSSRMEQALSFDNFDVHKVIQHGAPLYASGGQEFDIVIEEGMTAEQILHSNRQALRQRLGLAPRVDEGIEGLIDDSDVKAALLNQAASQLAGSKRKSGEELMKGIASKQQAALDAISPRQRYLAKRQMKSQQSQQKGALQQLPPLAPSAAASTPKTKTVVTDQPGDENKIVVEEGIDRDADDAAGEISPLAAFADLLKHNLFAPDWETRHGVAMGLREVLKFHALRFARLPGESLQENDIANRAWLEDCTLRFLSLFALEQFADYLEDQVVSPVRETCAQALGVLSKHLSRDAVLSIAAALTAILKHDDWQVRHGAMLGLKYIIAVRTDLAEMLLPSVLTPILECIQSREDDVRAVAADAALPLVPAIISTRTSEIGRILLVLWDILEELDDLTASTSSVMHLLAQFYVQRGSMEITIISPLDGSIVQLVELVPRLFPFFRHNIALVRGAALEVVESLLTDSDAHLFAWLTPLAQSVLRIIFQCVALESSPPLSAKAAAVWREILRKMKSDLLSASARPWLQSWINILSTPVGVEINPSELFYPSTSSENASGGVERTVSLGALTSDSTGNAAQQVTALTSDVRRASWLMRINGSRALGALYLRCWHASDVEIFKCSLLALLSSSMGTHKIVATLVIAHAASPDAVFGVKMEENGGGGGGGGAKGVELVGGEIVQQLLGLLAKADEPQQYGEIALLERKWREEVHDMLVAASAAGISHAQAPLAAGTANLSLQNALDLVRQGGGWLALVNEGEEGGGGGGVGGAPGGGGGEEVLLQGGVLDGGNTPGGGRGRGRGAGGAARGGAAGRGGRGGGDAGANGARRTKKVTPAIRFRGQYRQALSSLGHFVEVQENLQMIVMTCVADSLIRLQTLPEKIAGVVKALMTSLQKEREELLQTRAADALVAFLDLARERKPCPNKRIFNNLVIFLCGDTSCVPPLASLSYDESQIPSCETQSPPSTEEVLAGNDELLIQGRIARRGVVTTIKIAVRNGANDLLEKIGPLWETMNEGLVAAFTEQRRRQIAAADGNNNDNSSNDNGVKVEADGVVKTETIKQEPSDSSQSFDASQVLYLPANSPPLILQKAVEALSILSILVEDMSDTNRRALIAPLLPRIVGGCVSGSEGLRCTSARCIGTIARFMCTEVMEAMVLGLLPHLGDTERVFARAGAMQALHCVIASLQLDVVPYAVLLVVPLLGRMSDPHPPIRQAAAHAFANLIRLLPLEMGVPDPPGMSAALMATKQKDRRFLEQLLDNSKLEPHILPVRIEGELRSYQQEGVNWLAFLQKYNLHGILADDMGLGKTLQTLCIILSDVVTRQRRWEQTHSADSAPLPSLILCPPTLLGHWEHEANVFCRGHIVPVRYGGTKAERNRALSNLAGNSLLVMSYDVYRNDIKEVGQVTWNYLVLDEGHVIKNSKSKLFLALKQANAAHRLILSGTPIQNSVMELWALFDFLMPGFLGTEAEFSRIYAKPILASRQAKKSADLEAGTAAMEALHRQVLPLMLRRMKQDVLSELPPKIIQDLQCDLSPLQQQLYEAYSSTVMQQGLKGELEQASTVDIASGTTGAAAHIFQALQYLRKLCNHPALVVDEKHPLYNDVMHQVKADKRSIYDIAYAPKLQLLKQLLEDAAIGGGGGVEGGHRALIFCQQKVMLDIIEKHLFKPHLPSISYLRMDGKVPAQSRHAMQQKFNSDPTIDVLLLTTHVGGLGLNLTGADTVIFVEHDWNPMRDLQAMDRAHRIGQKRRVNVYRLITRHTLEEKIMGLQQFKLNIANTVISRENTSLQTMNTNQLLDLFTVGEGQQKTESSEAAEGGDKKGLKAVLSTLGDLWDQSQYAEEYDTESFVNSVHAASQK